MDRILFSIGPFPIYTFGAGIAIGVLIALWLADREAKRRGIDSEVIFTLSLIVLIAGVIGARIFYILPYDPVYYWQHPLDFFKIYEGGLSIQGGLFGAILAGWWYTRKIKLSFWKAADILAPAVILAQGISRVGCDVYGKVMAQSWPWGVYFQGNLVHPVQIYETLLDFALFIFLWGMRDRQKYPGQIFVYYLGGYSLIRFTVEFFRINPLWLGILTPAHLTSILFVTAAIVLAVWASRHSLINHELPLQTHLLWVSLRVWSAMFLLALISIGIFYTLN